jgi:hypothetical protein
MDRTENTASNSSIITCVFIAAGTPLPSSCLKPPSLQALIFQLSDVRGRHTDSNVITQSFYFIKIENGIEETGVNWMEVTQDGLQWRSLMSRVRNFWFHKRWGNFWPDEGLPASQEGPSSMEIIQKIFKFEIYSPLQCWFLSLLQWHTRA